MVWRIWRGWSQEYYSSFCTITLFFFSRLPLCLSCPLCWLYSFPLFQFHNKVTCFMLHHIEEPCSLGAHAAVIVPPTWIIKVKKPQVTACWRLFLKLSGFAGPVWLCRASLASLLGPPSTRHACSTLSLSLKPSIHPCWLWTSLLLPLHPVLQQISLFGLISHKRDLFWAASAQSWSCNCEFSKHTARNPPCGRHVSLNRAEQIQGKTSQTSTWTAVRIGCVWTGIPLNLPSINM